MSGSAFLLLYLVLLVAAVVVSIVGVRAARPDGRIHPAPSPDTLAWLAGGKQRLVDAAVAHALARGELTMTGRGKFADAAGQAMTWSAVAHRYGGAADTLERSLGRDGLMMDADARAALRRRALLPFGIVATIGTLRLIYGVAVGRPVGFLFALLILTGVIALIRGTAIDKRTVGGRETLARARSRNDRLRRAPLASETDMAVALFGTAVLAGSAQADFHRYRSASGDGGSSSADGGDGGGDGGCGGGCGGCGGGD